MSIIVPLIILIIAIPIYFVSKWIIKKQNLGNEKNRKFYAIMSTIVLSPLIYLGLIYLWIFSISYYPSTDFDRQEWETNVEERYKMSEHIIESEILIGKTKQEIIELLGDDFYSYNENQITYELGFVPGLFNIDSDVLDIYFENGKVSKVDQRET